MQFPADANEPFADPGNAPLTDLSVLLRDSEPASTPASAPSPNADLPAFEPDPVFPDAALPESPLPEPELAAPSPPEFEPSFIQQADVVTTSEPAAQQAVYSTSEPVPPEPIGSQAPPSAPGDGGAGGATDVVDLIDQIAAGDLTAVWPLVQHYAWPVASTLLILFVTYFVAKFVSRITSSPVRSRVDETLGRFVAKLVFHSIMVFAVLGVLGRYGISVASFAAVVAAAGFAIGMAFQGTLSNFASGILLLVFRPFKVGDVISAAGITAKVHEIDLFTTTFDTADNRRIIVPNSSITGTIIENITHNTERRVDVNVGCDYSADLNRTREALTAAAESLRDYLIDGDDRGYQIMLVDLGDSAVNWTVRFWTAADDYWEVRESLTGAVKEHLDAAGIGIPFPQLDVHVVGNHQGNIQQAA